jgi:hypothetical protein
MNETTLYRAVVCTECERAALVRDLDDHRQGCPECGSNVLEIPDGTVSASALTLFVELERVVHAANLSRSEAALIAAELESVGSRWEPPELALAQVDARLTGLRTLYDPRQEYSRLLLVAALLLMIVCAKLVQKSPGIHRTRYPSGFYLKDDRDTAPVAPKRRRA